MSMKIGRWEGNEIIYTIDVNGNSVNLMEDFDFTMDILGANMVVSGMVVTEALTPDMTIRISAGIAKDFTVGSFLIGNALIGVVTASDPVLDRRDIIEVRRVIDNITPATRQFKDPDTEDITESTIDTEVQYITEIKVLAGTPGTGLSLAVETGWIKIAEILVPAASLTVVNANIYNIDTEKAGVNNTNWTTTMASIHRNGTISEMKTDIVDNNTHRVSDGKDHSDVVLNNTHRNLDNTLLSVKSADYTITDSDHISVISMTTGATNRTVTLPTASANTGRVITLVKVDNGVGTAILDGEGTETINGTLIWEITEQWGRVKVKCDGSNWIVLEQWGCVYEVTNSAEGFYSNPTINIWYSATVFTGTGYSSFYLNSVPPGKYLMEWDACIGLQDSALSGLLVRGTLSNTNNTELDVRLTAALRSERTAFNVAKAGANMGKTLIINRSTTTTWYLNLQTISSNIDDLRLYGLRGTGTIRATRVG